MYLQTLLVKTNFETLPRHKKKAVKTQQTEKQSVKTIKDNYKGLKETYKGLNISKKKDE